MIIIIVKFNKNLEEKKSKQKIEKEKERDG